MDSLSTDRDSVLIQYRLSLLPILVSLCWWWILQESAQAASISAGSKFLSQHCFDCHDSESKKGGLDLSQLDWKPEVTDNRRLWIKIHDKVNSGEMPPKKQTSVPPLDKAKFLSEIARDVEAFELSNVKREGRSGLRRLNRHEYENTLRDLLGAPWLQLKEMLPEDGEAHRFNKSGEALDISHVQMARYLAAADYALREMIAGTSNPPESITRRFYARDQRSFTGPMKFSVFNTRPERATFPVLNFSGQPEVRSGKAPLSVGASDPLLREQEAVGVVASAYEPIEPKFNAFEAKHPGKYRIRMNGFTVWVGPGKPDKWWIPDLDNVSRGRRSEPITLYSEKRPRLLRRLGDFDLTSEPATHELEVYLLPGETIRPDATRLFRSRPPNWRNPLAESDGQPGVAWRWMEVEGPIYDHWPIKGHQIMFGALPSAVKTQIQVNRGLIPPQSQRTIRRLVESFCKSVCRRPVNRGEMDAFAQVAIRAIEQGHGFVDSMIAAYSGVLCSPAFLCLEGQAGPLNPQELASRLSYFLSNSAPDSELQHLAVSGKLGEEPTLVSEANRLLDHPNHRRFLDSFLSYWLDLRRIEATSPDENLYPDYYLDDSLTDAASEEARAFFAELIRSDLPAKHLVASDFVMVNERLADHYKIKGISGVKFQKVSIPQGNPRGGLMTMASVLKVTANGTTTSPVTRGAWIMERLLGQAPPPPPPSVPAIEPDIRGATTIRQQLEKHRNQESCSVCHVKIDPAGFALENFDVLGGWRESYRGNGVGRKVSGFGKNGQPFNFLETQPVDASGVLPSGETFNNVQEFKKLILKDERQIARNLVHQLIVFATGAPVGFSDRKEVEKILDRASDRKYGIRTLVLEVVRSRLFRHR